MRIDNISANKFRDGNEKILSLTIKTTDGRSMTVDYSADEAKGLAIWILYKLKELNEIPIGELKQLPKADEYRIID